MAANLPDPIEPDPRSHQLNYARGNDRSPGQRFARGCGIALLAVVVVFGLLFGTCMIMMRH